MNNELYHNSLKCSSSPEELWIQSPPSASISGLRFRRRPPLRSPEGSGSSCHMRDKDPLQTLYRGQAQ